MLTIRFLTKRFLMLKRLKNKLRMVREVTYGKKRKDSESGVWLGPYWKTERDGGQARRNDFRGGPDERYKRGGNIRA